MATPSTRRPSASPPDGPGPDSTNRTGLYTLLGALALLGAGIVLLFSGSRPREPEPTTTRQRARDNTTDSRSSRGERKTAASSAASVERSTPQDAPTAEGEVAFENYVPPGETRVTLWQKRLQRSEDTLHSYLESTKYPFGSRPLREHSDTATPNFVPPVTHPLARDDKKLTDAKVTLRQDRHFLTGKEVASLSVECFTSEGPRACEIKSALAMVPPNERGADVIAPVAVPFVVTGTPGDGTPSGRSVATFSPSASGFAQHHGPIRIVMQIGVDKEEGGGAFDFTYTPAAPAVFTHKVREVVEQGSLSLYVQLQVDRAGRYVITGRAADASGKGFAYLQFNDDLEAGLQEAKLQIFGKLIHDENAASPFKLRDVEGYLLKEGYPDRELMGMMSGDVYSTKAYPISSFSNDEWQSDEKTRHTDKYNEMISQAKDQLDKAMSESQE